MTREYTDKFYELVEDGSLSAESVMQMAMKYMSEDDVKDMWEANCMDD